MDLKPGFQQTEVGLIPKDWEAKQLGTIAIYTNGNAHEKSIKAQGRYVVVNSKFISSEGETRKYSDDCFCPTAAGDVLMVMSDVPNGKAIAKCFYVDRDNYYTVNQRICALKPTQVDGKLLFYKLNRNPFYLAFDDGAKQTNLRKNDVLSCLLSIPKTVEEQRAIATTLSDVDTLIGALDQLIAKKRDIKQAAMQQLLTGKRRLPGFDGKCGYKQTEVGLIPDDWGVKELGSILDHCRLGGNYPNQDEENSRPLMKMGNLGRGNIDLSKIQYISSRVNSDDSDRLQFGDLLFNTRNTLDLVGKVSIWRNELPVAYYNSNIMRLEFKPEEISSNSYANYLFNSPNLLVRLRAIATGTTSVAAIYTRDLLKLLFPIPSVPEQRAIAAVLSDMDTELDLLEQRRDKTRALKQGMMQELLTGKTRLV